MNWLFFNIYCQNSFYLFKNYFVVTNSNNAEVSIFQNLDPHLEFSTFNIVTEIQSHWFVLGGTGSVFICIISLSSECSNIDTCFTFPCISWKDWELPYCSNRHTVKSVDKQTDIHLVYFPTRLRSNNIANTCNINIQ